MTRTVFDNSMVAHVWAQQDSAQSEGRSQNGNFHFRGPAIYSYRTCIARFVQSAKGKRVLLRTSEKYSMTTTCKHEGAINKAIGYDDAKREYPVFYVPGITARYSSDSDIPHALNLDYLSDIARKTFARAATIPFHACEYEHRTTEYSSETSIETGRPQFLRHALVYAKTANEYARLFALPVPFKKDGETDLAKALAVYESRKAAWNDPKKAAKRAAAAAKREAARLEEERIEAAKRAAYELARHNEALPQFQAWQDGHGARPSAYAFLASSPERTAIETSIAAEKVERQKEERERSAAQFEAWRSGNAHYCPASYCTDETGGAYLRAVGDNLETSQGARVPLGHAIRVFHFVKKVKESGVAWRRNGQTIRVGHFTVDSIDVSGDFRAGCHLIRWQEVERLARLLNVFEDPASDEAVEDSHRAA